MEKYSQLIMKEELNRRFKVLNMMITMHSILCNRYKTRTLLGNIFFLVIAICLNIFVFFDFDYLKFLNVNEDRIKIWISIASTIIFILSVVFLIIDWGKKAEKHEQAVNQLSSLLNELRTILVIEDDITFKNKAEMFNFLYNQINETVPKIPNNKFNKLKAKHYYKIELSKFIDLHKGKPYFLIKYLFLKNKLKKNGNRDTA